MTSSDPIDPLVSEFARASVAAVTRAQVYVSVRGGIADAMVTRGDVEIILIDWDNMVEAFSIDYLREHLEYAQSLEGRDREDAVEELQDLIDRFDDE